MINYFCLTTSLALAATAAYFSIAGLSTIFSGAFWSVVIMASILEVGKLVTAVWLHHRWDKVNGVIRAYLIFSILVLMLITSMGIFGYLSKAHLEQESKSNTGELEISNLESRIAVEQSRLDAVNGQLASLDNAIDEYIERGFVTRGLAVRTSQKEEREALSTAQASLQEDIRKLTKEKFELSRDALELALEVGAIRYITELFYGEAAVKHYSETVRYIIIALVVVFDPLAVLLLVVSTNAIKEDAPVRRRPRKNPFLHKDNIMAWK